MYLKVLEYLFCWLYENKFNLLCEYCKFCEINYLYDLDFDNVEECVYWKFKYFFVLFIILDVDGWEFEFLENV